MVLRALHRRASNVAWCMPCTLWLSLLFLVGFYSFFGVRSSIIGCCEMLVGVCKAEGFAHPPASGTGTWIHPGAASCVVSRLQS